LNSIFKSRQPDGCLLTVNYWLYKFLTLGSSLLGAHTFAHAGSREGSSQESFCFATKRARQKLAPSLQSIFCDIDFLQKNLFAARSFY